MENTKDFFPDTNFKQSNASVKPDRLDSFVIKPYFYYLALSTPLPPLGADEEPDPFRAPALPNWEAILCTNIPVEIDPLSCYCKLDILDVLQSYADVVRKPEVATASDFRIFNYLNRLLTWWELPLEESMHELYDKVKITLFANGPGSNSKYELGLLPYLLMRSSDYEILLDLSSDMTHDLSELSPSSAFQVLCLHRLMVKAYDWYACAPRRVLDLKWLMFHGYVNTMDKVEVIAYNLHMYRMGLVMPNDRQYDLVQIIDAGDKFAFQFASRNTYHILSGMATILFDCEQYHFRYHDWLDQHYFSMYDPNVEEWFNNQLLTSFGYIEVHCRKCKCLWCGWLWRRKEYSFVEHRLWVLEFTNCSSYVHPMALVAAGDQVYLGLKLGFTRNQVEDWVREYIFRNLYGAMDGLDVPVEQNHPMYADFVYWSDANARNNTTDYFFPDRFPEVGLYKHQHEYWFIEDDSGLPDQCPGRMICSGCCGCFNCREGCRFCVDEIVEMPIIRHPTYVYFSDDDDPDSHVNRNYGDEDSSDDDIYYY